MRNLRLASLFLRGLAVLCTAFAWPALAEDGGIPLMAEEMWEEYSTPLSDLSPSPESARFLKDARTVEVEPGVEKLLVGYRLYSLDTCETTDLGSWTTTSPPTHGNVAFRTANLKSSSCDGSYPFNACYYTWTDNATEATQDLLSTLWSSSDGAYQMPTDWTVNRQAVVFKEKGTKYGWDDFTNPKIPWKSVRKGYGDTVLAEVTPASLYKSCAFQSSNKSFVKVSPSTAQSAGQTVTLKGIDKGASDVLAKNTKSHVTLRKMKGATYNNVMKTVSIRLVHKKGTGEGDPGYDSTNIPTSAIISMLKKVYKQAVIQWDVTRLRSKRVAFDLNKDGKIDVESWMSDEMRVIRDACKSGHDYNVFIVSHPTDGSCGFMEFNQKYAFIHADTCGNDRTVCHELGHGHGLTHTPADTMNIMYNYSSNTKWRLRKNQWDKLNP